MTFRDAEPGPSRRTIQRRFEIYSRVLPGEIAIILAEFTPVNSKRGTGIIRQMDEIVQRYIDAGADPAEGNEEARDLAYDEIISRVESGEELPWELASLASP